MNRIASAARAIALAGAVMAAQAAGPADAQPGYQDGIHVRPSASQQEREAGRRLVDRHARCVVDRPQTLARTHIAADMPMALCYYRLAAARGVLPAAESQR